jgi:hypothetical protein
MESSIYDMTVQSSSDDQFKHIEPQEQHPVKKGRPQNEQQRQNKIY